MTTPALDLVATTATFDVQGVITAITGLVAAWFAGKAALKKLSGSVPDKYAASIRNEQRKTRQELRKVVADVEGRAAAWAEENVKLHEQIHGLRNDVAVAKGEAELANARADTAEGERAECKAEVQELLRRVVALEVKLATA